MVGLVYVFVFCFLFIRSRPTKTKRRPISMFNFVITKMCVVTPETFGDHLMNTSEITFIADLSNDVSLQTLE